MYASRLIACLFLLDASVPAWAKDAPQPSPRQLEATLAQCAACHGRTGRSSQDDVPNLAGLNFDYLMYQLQRFADLEPGAATEGMPEAASPDTRDLERLRQRRSSVMSQHTDGLDAAALQDAARYFSSLRCVVPSAAKQTVPKPPVGTAWCADCHAPGKVKDLTNVPGLNGQKAKYLENQLLAFKRAAALGQTDAEGVRWHHFMSRSVRSYSDARLRDIANYYSTLPCGR